MNAQAEVFSDAREEVPSECSIGVDEPDRSRAPSPAGASEPRAAETHPPSAVDIDYTGAAADFIFLTSATEESTEFMKLLPPRPLHPELMRQQTMFMQNELS